MNVQRVALARAQVAHDWLQLRQQREAVEHGGGAEPSSVDDRLAVAALQAAAPSACGHSEQP